jgi:hypothetical protein
VPTVCPRGEYSEWRESTGRAAPQVYINEESSNDLKTKAKRALKAVIQK